MSIPSSKTHWSNKKTREIALLHGVLSGLRCSSSRKKKEKEIFRDKGGLMSFAQQ
jgi:hypothetical protein